MNLASPGLGTRRKLGSRSAGRSSGKLANRGPVHDGTDDAVGCLAVLWIRIQSTARQPTAQNLRRME